MPSGASCRSCVVRIVLPVMRQERPDRARVLVGQRHRRHVLVASRQQLGKPRIGIRFAFGCSQRRPRAVDEQRAQVGIAALADAQKRRLAAGGVLPGHDAQPGRQLPAVLEVAGIPDRGRHRRGRERAETRNGRQLLAGRVLPMPQLDFGAQLADLAVEFPEVVEQARDEQAEVARQVVLAVLDDLGHPPQELADPLREGKAVFGQQPANLVGLRRARLDEALPGAMHAEDRLLLNVLDRHRRHVRPRHGFADRRGIRRVVLVALDEGFYVLRCDQLHRVPERLQFPRPVVGAAAGFQADPAGRELREEGQHLRALQLLPQYRPSRVIRPMHLEHVLCQINPNRRKLHLGRPFRSSGCQSPPLWHIDAVSEGGDHPISRCGVAI